MLSTVRRAFRIMPGRRAYWWLLVGVAIAVSALEMAGALIVYILLELVVDPQGSVELPLIGDLETLAPGTERDTLVLMIVVGMGVFTLIRAAAKVGAKYIEYRIAHNSGARLSKKLVAGYFSLPYETHLHRNSAELVRNARQAVSEIVTGIVLPTIKVMAELLVMVGLMIVLISIDPLSTAFAVGVFGLVGVILLSFVQPRLKRIGRTAHHENQETYKSLQQALHGIRDIKILGREGYFADQYGRSQVRLARAQYMRSTVKAVPTAVIEAAIIGLILGLFGVSTVTGAGSEGLVSLLGLFAYAGLRLQPSMQQIIGGLNDIKHSTAPLDDVYADLAEIEQYTAESKKKTTQLPFDHGLEVDGVSFTYQGAESPALNGISLEIRPGEQIGVCGPTGGGKTTLIDLMTGLLTPDSGTIKVDGIDISERTRDWHASLGVVPQMVFLTDDTLRRNIALGERDEDIDEEALKRAIEIAQLTDFVDTLPAGLETVVGERGVRISGGQRQRIAIARAMYREPAILIMDEGTSALDNITEAELLDAVNALRGEQTVILIAHRLATVRNCDRVVFIDEGRIAGVGTYDDLSQSNTRFRLLSTTR